MRFKHNHSNKNTKSMQVNGVKESILYYQEEGDTTTISIRMK
jgi:hypothetical protein